MFKITMRVFAGFIVTIFVCAFASDYSWHPENITVVVAVDNEFLMIGKHLVLTNRLEEGEFGWIESKMDVPDNWDIKEIGLRGDDLYFEIQTGERFAIRPPKLNDLDFAILDGGKKSDAELARLWREYAGGNPAEP